VLYLKNNIIVFKKLPKSAGDLMVANVVLLVTLSL